MGLTVSRQTAKNLTINRQKRAIFTVNRQKAVINSGQIVSVKVLQISLFQLLISGCWLSKNRFTTSFHVPKRTVQLTSIWKYFWFQNINAELTALIKTKTVNINFNSWKKSPLDTRQPSKVLNFNLQPSKSAKFKVTRPK